MNSSSGNISIKCPFILPFPSKCWDYIYLYNLLGVQAIIIKFYDAIPMYMLNSFSCWLSSPWDWLLYKPTGVGELSALLPSKARNGYWQLLIIIRIVTILL